MANSRRKCKGCGEYGKVSEGIVNRAGYFHDDECLSLFISKNKEKMINKGRAKIAKEKKREYYKNSIKTRKRAAKEACHKYIKLRDKGNSCICCGREVPEGKGHAGHFLESGNHPFIRYDEKNIHLQHEWCNMYKGGDSGEYEPRLRKKIGDQNVDWLYDNKNKSIKRTAQDYKEIEDYYKQKIKEIEDEDLR